MDLVGPVQPQRLLDPLVGRIIPVHVLESLPARGLDQPVLYIVTRRVPRAKYSVSVGIRVPDVVGRRIRRDRPPCRGAPLRYVLGIQVPKPIVYITVSPCRPG